MADLHPVRVVTAAVTVRLRVPPAIIAPGPGGATATLGDRIAQRADEIVRERALGYYPALDYLIQSNDLGAELLAELEQASGRVVDFVAREIPRRLKPVFSSVRLRHGQFSARALPAVRPGQPQALAALARHYTPDTLRLELILGAITRGAADGLERVASRKVVWWLRAHFAAVDIVDSRLLEDR